MDGSGSFFDSLGKNDPQNNTFAGADFIGAMIGGFLLGVPTINTSTFNLTGLLVSFVGAVILLAIVNLVCRG